MGKHPAWRLCYRGLLSNLGEVSQASYRLNEVFTASMRSDAIAVTVFVDATSIQLPNYWHVCLSSPAVL